MRCCARDAPASARAAPVGISSSSALSCALDATTAAMAGSVQGPAGDGGPAGAAAGSAPAELLPRPLPLALRPLTRRLRSQLVVGKQRSSGAPTSGAVAPRPRFRRARDAQRAARRRRACGRPRHRCCSLPLPTGRWDSRSKFPGVLRREQPSALSSPAFPRIWRPLLRQDTSSAKNSEPLGRLPRLKRPWVAFKPDHKLDGCLGGT